MAKSHDLLSRELFLLHTKWNDYKKLFCTDNATVELLDYAASFFFQIVREVLRDDIILTICRMTDPAESRLGRKRKCNLTLEYLASIASVADGTLDMQLKRLLSEVKGNCRKFRDHRNRRLGHHDLDTSLKRPDALLPGIGIEEADIVLRCVGDFLNAVEEYYENDEQLFEQGIHGNGDASDLIDFIEHEKHLRDNFYNKEYGDPVPDESTP